MKQEDKTALRNMGIPVLEVDAVDIVQRLREEATRDVPSLPKNAHVWASCIYGLCAQAAAEIERLRLYAKDADILAARMLADKDREIMRLRAEIEQAEDFIPARSEPMRQEIGRLRAQQKGILAENQSWQMDATKYRSEAEILRVQIERLRAALHWTAQNCLDAKCARRAMDALMGLSSSEEPEGEAATFS